MKRRYIIAILAFLTCAVVLKVAGWRDQEPQYQGKPLRYWLMGYHVANGYWNTATPSQANEAVVHLGTNALPTLLQMIQLKDPFAPSARLLRWSYTWRRWAQHQHFMKVPTIPHLRCYEAEEAWHAFEELGPDAKDAVPTLIALYDQKSLALFSRGLIAHIFAKIGPDAHQAVPSLMRTVEDPIDSVKTANLRANALNALGRIQAKPEIVVPAATKALHDPDAYVRRCAAKTLGAFGVNAKTAVPTLLEVLNNAGEQRLALKAALKSSNSNPNALIGALNDPIFAAEQALKAIDPEAAAEADVK